MNLIDIRRYEMLVRVRDFGQEHATAFPADSFGARTFAEVGAAVSTMSQEAAAQFSGRTSGREGTTSKAAARAALRDTLDAFTRTAFAVSLDVPGIEDKFRVPRFGDQRLLAAARAFAQDAQLFTAAFTKHEMSPTFLDDLNAEIDDLERAIHDQALAKETRIAAQVAIEMAMEAGLGAVQRLDAIVQNKLRDDFTALALWQSARHVDRPGKARASAPAPVPSSPVAQGPVGAHAAEAGK